MKNKKTRVFIRVLLGVAVFFLQLVCLFSQTNNDTSSNSFIIGACTHIRQPEGPLLNENISVIKQTGIMAIRDEISWSRCETVKGQLSIPKNAGDFVFAANNAGISPLLILDYANKYYDDGDYPRSPEAIEGFVRYSELIVKSFKGKCKFYQVWNEWDGGCGMPAKSKGKGDPESYINLLKAVYPRIKAIDPSIVVISNSVCTGDDYLRRLLELDLLKYCDVVAIHTYNYGQIGTNRTPEKWHERMLGIDKMLREFSGGKEVPLFITEMGWPTHIEGSGSTQSDSADFLARLFILAKTLPFLKGIWWYDFQDDGWDFKYNENNFGMVRPDFTPKKSYYVLKDLAPLIKNATFSERIDAGDPNIWVLKFETFEKEDIIAVWSAYPDNDWLITLKADSEITPEFSMICPGEGDTKRSFVRKDWVNKMDVDKKSFSLIVRSRPYLLKGNFSGVNSVSVKKIDFPESMRPKNRVVVVPEKIGRAVPLAEKTEVNYDFGEDKNYRVISESRKGKDDIDANFSIKWEPSAIHLFVTVRDDIFSQEFSGEDTWKGDGIQLAFQPFKDGLANPEEHVDFDIALTKNGPIVYERSASRLSDVTNEVEIKIDQKANDTSYYIKFPIKIMGLSSLKSDTIFGFSILVNDNDGKGRKGYLHWGDGIGHGKDPSLYNWITLE